MRRVILIGVMALLVASSLLLGATGALAAGKAKGGAELFVSAGTPLAATTELRSYSPVTFSGCGYVPNVGVTIVMNSPTAISFFGGTASSNGCISITNTTNDPGSYSAKAYQQSGPRSVLMATAQFDVVP